MHMQQYGYAYVDTHQYDMIIQTYIYKHIFLRIAKVAVAFTR